MFLLLVLAASRSELASNPWPATKGHTTVAPSASKDVQRSESHVPSLSLKLGGKSHASVAKQNSISTGEVSEIDLCAWCVCVFEYISAMPKFFCHCLYCAKFSHPWLGALLYPSLVRLSM